MAYIPRASGVVRKAGDTEVRNMIARDVSAALSLAVATLDGVHSRTRSELSDRAYYIVDGTGRVTVGSDTHDVCPGDAVYIPKGTIHAIEGRLQYVVVNVPPFDPSAERPG